MSALCSQGANSMRTVPKVSACAWLLTGPPLESLRRLRGLGFDMVDLRTDCWDGIRLADLRNAGLTVPCVGITPASLPDGLTLDALATADAETALPCLVGSLERAASLGVKTAYLVTPPSRVGGEQTYISSMSRLGDEAARLGVKLCVEPSPGFALGDYTETVRMLDAANSDGLFALLDLGHLLLTGEDPVATIRMLGDRLGYVHVDDNDGLSDVHYGLLEGVLSESTLHSFLDALARSAYNGPLAIEIKSDIPSPLSSLVNSRTAIANWASAQN